MGDDVARLNEEETAGKLFGRGSRVRKEIDYSEPLTDKEWLRAVDDGVDVDELGEKKKRQKRKRGPDETMDTPRAAKKKCGRPPVEKPSPNPPALTKIMSKILEHVIKHTDTSGRRLSDPFPQLQPRKS